MTDPLGVLDKNPGNIVTGPVPWVGQTGTNGRFCVFDTPEHGIRALAKLLLAYQVVHGLTTVRGIINRWAPPVENNTSAYVTDVAQDMQVDPDATIDLHSAATLTAMCTAIIWHENGEQPYADSVLAAGVADALGVTSSPAATPSAPP